MKRILLILGIITVFGSIGACDTETIGFAQAMMQCLIGLPMMLIGAR